MVSCQSVKDPPPVLLSQTILCIFNYVLLQIIHYGAMLILQEHSV